MANRPTGVDEAIQFIWNQPDRVLQSSEKQRLSAALAKETDVVARRYFLAPLPEQWVGTLKELLAPTVEMVDCETNEPSIKPFTVPRNWRGQLNVEAIEKSLAASQHILEGIVHGNRHGYPACRDGWTCTSYTGTPIQIQVTPKPGAKPKQALAYPTQDSFLSQMWRTLVA